MNKNIENITEELMMRYVEGSLNSDESEKFERILSQNDYLNRRVSILQSIADNKPLKSPPRSTYNQVLSNLNIENESGVSIVKRYLDCFMNIFENRPFVLGSFIVTSIAIFLVSIIVYNNIALNSSLNDNKHISEKEFNESNQKSSAKEDLNIE